MASTRGSAAVRPFPWGSLESIRLANLAAFRAIRHRSATFVRVEDAARALGAIVDARISVQLRRAQRSARVRTLDDGVSLVVARADEPESSHGILLEAESALATALVARALKRPAPRVAQLSQPPTANIAGALGAIVVAAARTVHQGAPLRILAAGVSAEVAREFTQRWGEVDEATFTLLLDHEAFLARLAIPTGEVQASPTTWGPAELVALGEMELAMPIVASSSLATAAEIASLGVGDAWLPGNWPLSRRAAGWVGPVWLAAPEAETALLADLGEDGRLVLRGDTAEIAWSPSNAESAEERAMGEGENRPDVTAAVGELPVIVRVEVGSARMRAREWAALGAGDVVALGRRVAEPVILRVAGVEVARGELVDLDGEVGVRILARLSPELGTR